MQGQSLFLKHSEMPLLTLIQCNTPAQKGVVPLSSWFRLIKSDPLGINNFDVYFALIWRWLPEAFRFCPRIWILKEKITMG